MGKHHELRLPATSLSIAHVMCEMAGVDRVEIYEGPQHDSAHYKGTMHKPTGLELLNLPMAIVRKFGPGRYDLVGKCGARELEVIELDASSPPVAFGRKVRA